MADIGSLPAEPRDRVGKGATRALRRTGRVPAVIYGSKEDPLSVSLDPKMLDRELNSPGFFARLYDVAVDGGTHRVLPRDVQYDVVRDTPIHVDFLRVGATTRLNVNVPVRFVNEEECEGLRRGGVLNVVRHEVELSCRADSIPPELIANLTGLDIGASIHISDIALPEGVTPTIDDRDFTVATIAAPTVVAEREVEEVEGEEIEGEGEEVEGEAAEGEAEATEET